MLVAPALGQSNKTQNEKPKVEQLAPDPEFYEVITENNPVMEMQMISQASHNAMVAAYNTRLAIQKRVDTSAGRAARAITELFSYESLYERGKKSIKPAPSAKDEFGDIVTSSSSKLFVDKSPPMMIDLIWAVMVGSLPDQYLSSPQQKLKSVLQTDLGNFSNMSSGELTTAAKVCLSNLFKYEKHHDAPKSYIESQRLFLIDLAQAAHNPLTRDFADHLMHQRFQEVRVGQPRQFWLHTPNDVKAEPLRKGQQAEKTTIVEVDHKTDNIYTIRYFRLYQIGPPGWYVRLKTKKTVEDGNTTYVDLPYESHIVRLAAGKWWTFLDGSLNEAAPYVTIGPAEEEVEVTYNGERGAAPTIRRLQMRDIPNRSDFRVEELPSGSFGIKTVRPYDRKTDPPLDYQGFMSKVRIYYDAHPADGWNPLLVLPNTRPTSIQVAQAPAAEPIESDSAETRGPPPSLRNSDLPRVPLDLKLQGSTPQPLPRVTSATYKVRFEPPRPPKDLPSEITHPLTDAEYQQFESPQIFQKILFQALAEGINRYLTASTDDLAAELRKHVPADGLVVSFKAHYNSTNQYPELVTTVLAKDQATTVRGIFVGLLNPLLDRTKKVSGVAVGQAMASFFKNALEKNPNDLLTQMMLEAASSVSERAGGRLPATVSPRLVIIPDYPQGGGWDEEGDLEKWPNEAADFLLQLQKATDFLDAITSSTEKAFALAAALDYKPDSWLTAGEVKTGQNSATLRAEVAARRRDIDVVRHWLNSLREKPDEKGNIRMTVSFYIEKPKRVPRFEPYVLLPRKAYGTPGPDGGWVPPGPADRRMVWDALINTVSAGGQAEPGTGDAMLRLLNRYYDDPNNDDTNKNRKADLPPFTNETVTAEADATTQTSVETRQNVPTGVVVRPVLSRSFQTALNDYRPMPQLLPMGVITDQDDLRQPVPPPSQMLVIPALMLAPSRYLISRGSRGGDQDVVPPSADAAARGTAKPTSLRNETTSNALVEINVEYPDSNRNGTGPYPSEDREMADKAVDLVRSLLTHPERELSVEMQSHAGDYLTSSPVTSQDWDYLTNARNARDELRGQRITISFCQSRQPELRVVQSSEDPHIWMMSVGVPADRPLKVNSLVNLIFRLALYPLSYFFEDDGRRRYGLAWSLWEIAKERANKNRDDQFYLHFYFGMPNVPNNSTVKDWASSSSHAGDLNPYFADNAKHSVISEERGTEISAAVHVVKAQFPEKPSDNTPDWIGAVPGQESETDFEARNNIQQVVALINKILSPGDDVTGKHVADKLRGILIDKGSVTLKYYVIEESRRWTGNNPGRRILDQATSRVAEDYIGVNTSNLHSPAALVIVTLLALLPSDKASQPEVRDIMREIAALLDNLDASNNTLVSDITPSLATIEVGNVNNFKSWTEAVNAILANMPLENMQQLLFNSRTLGMNS